MRDQDVKTSHNKEIVFENMENKRIINDETMESDKESVNIDFQSQEIETNDSQNQSNNSEEHTQDSQEMHDIDTSPAPKKPPKSGYMLFCNENRSQFTGKASGFWLQFCIFLFLFLLLFFFLCLRICKNKYT